MKVLKRRRVFLRFPLMKVTRTNKMKILIFVLMFFIIGALFIITNDNLAMYRQENIERFSKLYFEWINQIYVNTQALMRETLRLDWLP